MALYVSFILESSKKKISSTWRFSNFAIFIASSRVGLYLLFSMAIIVWRVTPNFFAISSWRKPASFLSCFIVFFIWSYTFMMKKVPMNMIIADSMMAANRNHRNLFGSLYSSSPAIIFCFKAYWEKP